MNRCRHFLEIWRSSRLISPELCRSCRSWSENDLPQKFPYLVLFKCHNTTGCVNLANSRDSTPYMQVFASAECGAWPNNTVASHEFPCHNQITKTGRETGHQRPREGEADFIQASVFQTDRPARASSTNPKVARDRAGDQPRKGARVTGTRAADRAVAAARSALSLSDDRKGQDSEGGRKGGA